MANQMENSAENNIEVIVEKPVSRTKATPLLFIHGMCHGAWCWEEHFLPHFARHGYTSYALSLRGHGQSESQKSLRWLSLRDYISDVTAVASNIEKPPVLIGHSMGGMIVQKYLENNQAPAAVMLASIPPYGVLPSTVRFALSHPLVFIRINATMSLYPLIATPERCKELLFSKDRPENRIEKDASLMQDESYRAFWDITCLNLPHPKRVRTPMLVLGGASDAIVSIRGYKTTARAYGTKAEIFPNMGHDMMLDLGWQTVADRILEWLNRQVL
jgi:alpha-beta hydrolase superfamily lysophospholipase